MKECFIITPIGGRGSETRRETDGLIKNVFEPVLAKFEFSPVPAHQISESGSITRQILKRLLEAELVIANLTDLNPNVMYEVGIRHCARKPMIVVAKEGTILPFDLSDERTIFFKNDMSGSEELKERLIDILPNAIKDESPDNPVYRVVDVDLIKLPEETPEVSVLANKRYSLIEEQLEEIQNSIRWLTSTGNNPQRSGGIINDLLKQARSKPSFSVYIDTEEQLTRFQDTCDTLNIIYKVEEVYKEVDKFTAYYRSDDELKVLQNLAKEFGVDEVA